MFRQQFMTIDPATKFGSRRDLMPPDGSRRNFEELRVRLEGKPSLIVEEPPTGYNSGQTLDIGRLITESRGRLHGEKVGIPRPSLMLGKSEYTYHLNQTHHAGKVSQKAIQAQHLSPRSSRLLFCRGCGRGGAKRSVAHSRRCGTTPRSLRSTSMSWSQRRCR